MWIVGIKVENFSVNLVLGINVEIKTPACGQYYGYSYSSFREIDNV